MLLSFSVPLTRKYSEELIKIWSLGSTLSNSYLRDFHGGLVVKNLLAHAGDTGSIPGSGTTHMLLDN